MDRSRLRRLADTVDDHVDDEQHEAMRSARRRFLQRLGGGAVLTAGASAASALAWPGRAAAQTTTGGSTTTAASTTTTTSPPKQATQEDIAILVFAQSLELALVEVYGLAVKGGRVGEEMLTIVAAFRNHHLQHAQTVAGLAGKAALNVANESMVADFGPRVERAADEAGVLEVLFELENTAASTYTAALGELRALNPAAATANILPIEARHAVVLGEALDLGLDEYVPPFERPEDAATPDEFPILAR